MKFLSDQRFVISNLPDEIIQVGKWEKSHKRDSSIVLACLERRPKSSFRNDKLGSKKGIETKKLQ